MLCPICHRNETNRIVAARFGGAVMQGEVCENCYDFALTFSREEFYNAFLKQADKACKYCGCRLSQIEDSLLVGCQMCYQEFYNELKVITERLQGIDFDDN